jgi:hypothetical protein
MATVQICGTGSAMKPAAVSVTTACGLDELGFHSAQCVTHALRRRLGLRP